MSILATKPKGRLAKRLGDLGLSVEAVEQDEGNVDRYLLSGRLAIERRTGSTLLSGITDKSLFTSAIYLREHFAIPVLIIEGEVDYARRAFDPQAVRGALSAMVLEYRMSVLATSAVEETAQLIAMMARQEQLGIPEISLIPKRKAADLADMQRRIVEMFPRCGRVAARQLLQRFGSVTRIANATEEELRAVKGIGAGAAGEIRKVLDSEYESVDTEAELEDAIEAAPQLLFERPVAKVARQHLMFVERKERHVIDLAFHDPEAGALILVELKRGRLTREHEEQLRRYLDNAHRSKLLQGLLARGAKLLGVLATVEACVFEPLDSRITVRIVDRKNVIAILGELRAKRLGEGA